MIKRIKLADRELPKYTKGEEIFNMVSHIVGVPLGIVAIVLCVITAAIHGNPAGVVSASIYGTTMILLYTMSSIYHGLSPNLKAKKVFQIFDHCSIYLLIAGSYTPFALCTLREYNTATGWIIFGAVWGLAVLGIVLNAIDLKRYRVFSMICYLAMGWLIIFRIDILFKTLAPGGLILLVLGGISYTLGAIFYGIGRKHKYMHSVFHLFILVGSILQFFSILLYVM
ncbi:MAG: hemolysin III family protein [Clostridia bacterium]|nr:hemolysin III family protein [Clostridia bacterium]